MSTRPVPSIIDEQLAEVERRHSLLIPPGQSLPEALGMPPETRLIDTPIRSLMTIRNGGRYLEVRS